MIRIGKPRLEPNGDHFIRLVADFIIDGEKRTVWAEVSSKYKDYLCYERCDAFVVGVLNYAMRHRHDIECEAPIGEDLYYQISVYLIEALCKSSKVLYKTRIFAEIDSSVFMSAGAVGTGISCGVDSFHVLAMQSDTPFKRHQLTHLAFNNVGSHGTGEEARKLYTERKQLAEKFCQENGFELIELDSNLMDMIPQSHFLSNTYSSCFAILALQKLYSIYYLASSDTFQEFSLEDNERYPSGYYDLLSLDVFSTSNLRIYSEGGVSSRLEKTKQIVEYTLSYKYLNVCIKEGQNCSRCEKCTRTLLALDVVGKLDEYKEVFDIGYYKSHKQQYFKTLIIEKSVNNAAYKELYPFLKQQISFLTYVKAIPGICKETIRLTLKPGKFRDRIKQLYYWGKQFTAPHI